jgi:hypothetical protein
VGPHWGHMWRKFGGWAEVLPGQRRPQAAGAPEGKGLACYVSLPINSVTGRRWDRPRWWLKLGPPTSTSVSRMAGPPRVDVGAKARLWRRVVLGPYPPLNQGGVTRRLEGRPGHA